MFIPFKEGQKVWTPVWGWGTIVKIKEKSVDEETVFPIICVFSSHIGETTQSFTLTGCWSLLNTLPILFHNEVKDWPCPKPPLPKLDVDTKVVVWNEPFSIKHKRHFSHFDETTGVIHCFTGGHTSWSSLKPTTATWSNWELAE